MAANWRWQGALPPLMIEPRNHARSSGVTRAWRDGLDRWWRWGVPGADASPSGAYGPYRGLSPRDHTRRSRERSPSESWDV